MITLTLSTTELTFIKSRALATSWGGKSSIRGEDRQQTLQTDQLIGHCGEYAGIMILFGDNKPYYASQQLSERLHQFDPSLGDGGEDIIGANLDFKTSRQHESRSPLEHGLAVRPHEMRDNWVYVLMIVLSNDELIGFNFDKQIDVCMVGWATSDMMPKHTLQKGAFKGAHYLAGNKLIRPMPIQWRWRLYK